MSRRSAVEFVFAPHKSDTIFRNVNDARLNLPRLPSLSSSLYPLPPLLEAEQLPTHCCNTQHLLAVAARCYFFIWTKNLPCHVLLLFFPLVSLVTLFAGTKGLEIKEGDGWRDAECGMITGHTYSKDHSSDARPFGDKS